MKAFLTGATGFVGHHVLRALSAQGARVRCLVRPGSRREGLDVANVELVEGDLTNFESVRAGMADCDVAFHVAADYRLFVRDPSEMYASNVEGTRNVLKAAVETGLDRVVYTSTVGTLGPMPDGSPATEESAVTLNDMVGHYKRSKFLAKRVAKEWASKGAPVVIVHPSAPVGELDHKPTATGKIILDFLNRKLPAYVRTGLNLVDVRDVAAGHLLAAEKGRIGEEYILGHRNMTLREIFETLSQLTGLAPPKIRLPHWIPLAIASADTAAARVLPREPWLPLEAVQLSKYLMYFDASKAVRDLGMPQTPIERALERSIEWYRENGYVKA